MRFFQRRDQPSQRSPMNVPGGAGSSQPQQLAWDGRASHVEAYYLECSARGPSRGALRPFVPGWEPSIGPATARHRTDGQARAGWPAHPAGALCSCCGTTSDTAATTMTRSCTFLPMPSSPKIASEHHFLQQSASASRFRGKGGASAPPCQPIVLWQLSSVVAQAQGRLPCT